jgi:hypothetical protein
LRSTQFRVMLDRPAVWFSDCPTYGILLSMAREKTSVTIDRSKVDEVRRLTGAGSTSAAIDLALGELIAVLRLRRDLAAYGNTPPSDDELALSRLSHDWSDLADDTDWGAAYRDSDR